MKKKPIGHKQHGVLDEKRKKWLTVPNCEICRGLLFTECLDDPKIKRHATLHECVGHLKRSLEHQVEILSDFAAGTKNIERLLKKKKI